MSYVQISAFYASAPGGHYKRMPDALADAFTRQSKSFDILALDSLHLGIRPKIIGALQNPFGFLSMKAISQIEDTLVRLLKDLQRENEQQTVILFEGSMLWLEILSRVATQMPNTHFVINVHNGFAMHTFTQGGPSMALLLGRLMYRASKIANLTVTVENDLISRNIEQTSGFEPGIFPIFTSDVFGRGGQKAHDLVFFSGLNSKEALGFLAAIRKVSDHPLLVFPGPVLSSLRKLDISSDFREVRLIDASLMDDEYQAIFKQARAAWFCYFEKFNFFGSSGKLIDVLTAGGIPVVPKGSALASIAKRHGARYLEFTSAKEITDSRRILDLVVSQGQILTEPLDADWAAKKLLELHKDCSQLQSSKASDGTWSILQLFLLIFRARLQIRLTSLRGSSLRLQPVEQTS